MKSFPEPKLRKNLDFILFHRNELIFSRAKTNLDTVLERFFPMDIGMVVLKMIVKMRPIGICQMIAELAVANRGRSLTHIDTCLIERHGIK